MIEETVTAHVSVQLIGGPTTVIEVGGLRFVTDPTFDPPGIYDLGGRFLTKSTEPALSLEEIGHVDTVLLSHDQHADNLDRKGREWIATVRTVLTTSAASERIPGTIALPNWSHVDLDRPDGGTLRITGVPAQHGPDNTEHLVGEVTGFVITGKGIPTIYVSGDNASLSVVVSVSQRFPSIDISIVFCGAARTPLLGDANLTLGSEEAAMAAQILGSDVVIPVHFEGWMHFTEGEELLQTAFEKSQLDNCLHLLKPGERFVL